MKKVLKGVLIIVLVLSLSIVGLSISKNGNKAVAKELIIENSWFDEPEYNDYDGTLSAINNMLEGMSATERNSYKSNPIVIAVIDTGANMDHELLSGLLYENPLEKNGSSNIDDDKNGYKDDICGWDFVSGDNNPTDECTSTSLDGHGSHVTGIVATEIRKYGLEDYIKILPIRAGNSSGSFSTTCVANAISYAISIKNKNNLTMVINMSFKNKLSSWTTNGQVDKKVQEAVKAGIVMVAAAGNDGYESTIAGTTGSPAGLNNVIGVMAYQQDDGTIRNYNYGSAYDLAAPGYKINSASRTDDAGYVIKNGTSMASPIVAFMAAVLCIHFERDSSMVYEAIINSSTESTGTVEIISDPGKTTKKVVYTAKKANLKAFLDYAPVKKVEIIKNSGNESQHINSTSPIVYEVLLYKYGNVDSLDINDALYNDITISIAKCDEMGNVTDEIVASQKGRTIEFTPTEPGNYVVYAGLSGYSNENYVSAKFYVNYASVSDAELKINYDEVKVRVDGSYIYSLNNYYKINPDVAVTWSVYNENDVLVASFAGSEFTFVPDQTGDYVLICKVGSDVVGEQNIKVYISQIEANKMTGGIAGGLIILICFVVLIISTVKVFKKKSA